MLLSKGNHDIHSLIFTGAPEWTLVDCLGETQAIESPTAMPPIV